MLNPFTFLNDFSTRPDLSTRNKTMALKNLLQIWQMTLYPYNVLPDSNPGNLDSTPTGTILNIHQLRLAIFSRWKWYERKRERELLIKRY